MTERTIRNVAKEMAGRFYEQASAEFGSALHDRERSKAFRETYPTLRHFIRGTQVKKDGSLHIDKPGWLFFVVPARERLAKMLADTSIHENVKEGIMKALLEEHEKAMSPKAQSLLQRRMGDTPTFSQ